jgi:putative ABC transport system ATP-binding protein
LSHRIDHSPSQLSGGEQQRAAIARAIVTNPPLILADEPTGALDSATGWEILQVLTALNRVGRTIVLVTHDIQIARQAGRIISIRDGEIISDKINLDRPVIRRRGDAVPQRTSCDAAA